MLGVDIQRAENPLSVFLCWQMLQQELALYWSSVEDLEQRFQTLPGFEASEQLGTVREQLQALQKLADAR